jgi:hypothetical protein
MTSWPAGSLVVAARAPGLLAGSAISTPSARSRSTSVSTSATTKESVTAEALGGAARVEAQLDLAGGEPGGLARELTRTRQPEVAAYQSRQRSTVDQLPTVRIIVRSCMPALSSVRALRIAPGACVDRD